MPDTPRILVLPADDAGPLLEPTADAITDEVARWIGEQRAHVMTPDDARAHIEGLAWRSTAGGQLRPVFLRSLAALCTVLAAASDPGAQERPAPRPSPPTRPVRLPTQARPTHASRTHRED